MKILLESLRNGDGRVRAVKVADIAYHTFLDWMDDDCNFCNEVKKAEKGGDDKLKDICKRRILEDKSWQSAAWWLERNFPDEYRQRQDIGLSEMKEKTAVLFAPVVDEISQEDADSKQKH